MSTTQMTQPVYFYKDTKSVGFSATMKNKLKQIREALDWTQQDLADKIGTSYQNVSHWENFTRNIAQRFLIKISEVTGRSIDEILGHNDDSPKIPLVGYVGAGTTMRCNNITDEPMDWIDPITVGLSQNFPAGTMFIQVKGNSMVGSADDGDYVWLNSNDVLRGTDIDNLLNRRAVVVCKDGFNYYKKIRRGDKKGTYNLHSLNTPEIMENMQLQCAYVVHGVIYR